MDMGEIPVLAHRTFGFASLAPTSFSLSDERPNRLRVIFVTRVTQGGRKAARPSFEDTRTMRLLAAFVKQLVRYDGNYCKSAMKRG